MNIHFKVAHVPNFRFKIPADFHPFLAFSLSLGKVHSGAILNKSWRVTVVLPKYFCVELGTKISMNLIPYFYRCNDSADEFCSRKLGPRFLMIKIEITPRGPNSHYYRNDVHITPCVEWILQKCRKYPWNLHALNVWVCFVYELLSYQLRHTGCTHQDWILSTYTNIAHSIHSISVHRIFSPGMYGICMPTVSIDTADISMATAFPMHFSIQLWYFFSRDGLKPSVNQIWLQQISTKMEWNCMRRVLVRNRNRWIRDIYIDYRRKVKLLQAKCYRGKNVEQFILSNQ